MWTEKYYRLLQSFIDHGVFWALASFIISMIIPLTDYAQALGPLTVVFWKFSMVCFGAWLGNLLYVHYFCENIPVAECKPPDVHRLYFILGISFVFSIR